MSVQMIFRQSLYHLRMTRIRRVKITYLVELDWEEDEAVGVLLENRLLVIRCVLLVQNLADKWWKLGQANQRHCLELTIVFCRRAVVNLLHWRLHLEILEGTGSLYCRMDCQYSFTDICSCRGNVDPPASRVWIVWVQWQRPLCMSVCVVKQRRSRMQSSEGQKKMGYNKWLMGARKRWELVHL